MSTENEEVKQVQFVRQKTSREIAMEEIAAKYEQEEETKNKPEESNAAAQEAPPTAPVKEPEEPAAAAPIDELETIKVYGVEQKVPRSKLIEEGRKALQMESAAEHKLAEAKRLVEQAKNPQPGTQVDEDLTKLVMDAPFNEEAARKLAARLTSQPAHPDIRQEVRSVLSEQEVLTQFKKDYPEIVKDPFLLKLAVDEEDKARKNEDHRSPTELWKEIGDKLYEWKGINKAAPVDQLAERTARKESITNLPTASARVPAPEVKPPPTPSDIVRMLRQARHQRID